MQNLNTNQSISTGTPSFVSPKTYNNNKPLIPADIPVVEEQPVKIPIASEKLFDSYKDLASSTTPAETDNAGVEIPKNPDYLMKDMEPVNPKHDTALDVEKFNVEPVDNTSSEVKVKEKTEKEPVNIPSFTAPPVKDRQGEMIAARQKELEEKNARARQTYNDICNGDPEASGINGHMDFGIGTNSDWQKVGISPLEGAAKIYGSTIPALGVLDAAMATGDAIKDPTALNIATAGLSVTGAAAPALGMAKQAGQMANATKFASGAAKAQQAVSGVSDAAGAVGLVNSEVQSRLGN